LGYFRLEGAKNQSWDEFLRVRSIYRIGQLAPETAARGQCFGSHRCRPSRAKSRYPRCKYGEKRMRTLQILIIVSLLALPIAGYGIWTSSNNSQPEGVVDPISPVADPIDPLAPIDISEVPEVISQRPRSEAIFERFRSIDQLQSQVDFTIKFPESLPRGFTLKGAYESIVLQKYEDHTINEITLIYWDRREMLT